MFPSTRRTLTALRAAGFGAQALAAVRRTPAMWAQLTRFVREGGRIERVAADFCAATGQPGLIRFFAPPPPAPSTHATFAALAHELGHALQCPEQWRPPTAFASAQAYARSRELGEAHAWLNQYRLCRARAGAGEPDGQRLRIENDHDFGTHTVDLFVHIEQRLAQGWGEPQLLAELAVLNANMFPSGMGEGNFKTYGQCNRWDWLCATSHAPLQRLVARLPRAPDANDQKLLTKFNVFTGAAPPSDAELAALASAMAALAPGSGLVQLHALARAALPAAPTGVALAYASELGGASQA